MKFELVFRKVIIAEVGTREVAIFFAIAFSKVNQGIIHVNKEGEHVCSVCNGQIISEEA